MVVQDAVLQRKSIRDLRIDVPNAVSVQPYLLLRRRSIAARKRGG